MKTDAEMTISDGARVIHTTMDAIERAADSIPPGALDADDDPGKFSLAPEVEALANELISREVRFGHLAEACILYLWRNGGWTSKGRHVMGKAYVLNEEQRFLTGRDLKVIVNKEVWEQASDLQREALVAHELCHFEPTHPDKDGNPRWRNALHDVEEFAFIVRRYGLWDESLRMFMQAKEAGDVERAQVKMFEYDSETIEDRRRAIQEEADQEAFEEKVRFMQQCEPQTASEESNQPASEDALADANEPGTHARSVLGDVEFTLLDHTYEGTDLPVYETSGDFVMDQIREAAFQARLPRCVIRVTKHQNRAGLLVPQTLEYAWDGDMEIQRLTASKRPHFVREHAVNSA